MIRNQNQKITYVILNHDFRSDYFISVPSLIEFIQSSYKCDRNCARCRFIQAFNTVAATFYACSSGTFLETGSCESDRNCAVCREIFQVLNTLGATFYLHVVGVFIVKAVGFM